jgi:hypothetical protein
MGITMEYFSLLEDGCVALSLFRSSCRVDIYSRYHCSVYIRSRGSLTIY